MDADTDKLRRYFLGYLDRSEIEELEIRFISDPKVFSELLVVENLLIEDYVDGSLIDEEKRRFREFYLITTERSKNVKFEIFLREYFGKKDSSSSS